MSETHYSDLTEIQLLIIDDYCKNDMQKLKNVCYTVWGRGNLANMYHDDLYSDAMKVLLESVRTFRENENTKFNTYLTNNVRMSYGDWFRDNNLRAKRNNLELDHKRRIKRDEKGNPIIIKNVSFDTPVEDGIQLFEKVSSNKKVEDEISDLAYTYLEELLEDCTYEMREYMDVMISKLQRKILELIVNNYTKEMIIDYLNIDSDLYADSMIAIKSKRNTRKLRKKLEERANVR